MLKKGLSISLKIAFLFSVFLQVYTYFFTLCLKFISFPQLRLSINLFCFSLELMKTFDTTKSFLCLETFFPIIVSFHTFTLFLGEFPLLLIFYSSVLYFFFPFCEYVFWWCFSLVDDGRSAGIP